MSQTTNDDEEFSELAASCVALITAIHLDEEDQIDQLTEELSNQEGVWGLALLCLSAAGLLAVTNGVKTEDIIATLGRSIAQR